MSRSDRFGETFASLGLANGKRAALLIIFRQPGANIIETVDGIKAALPQLHASIDPVDQSGDYARSDDHHPRFGEDVERTLADFRAAGDFGGVCLFARLARHAHTERGRAGLASSARCGAMYLFGFSIDNLSLMALTISTGFVVDDAIVVLENITRYRETGMNAMEAALRERAEIGPTVLSISISLVSVFIPILMMGGIVGRLFREFAVTLSVTIMVSMLVSLTTTPMMCSRLLEHTRKHGRLYLASERFFEFILRTYERSLRWVMGHSAIVLVIADCHALPQHLPVRHRARRDSSRSRTPAG